MNRLACSVLALIVSIIVGCGGAPPRARVAACDRADLALNELPQNFRAGLNFSAFPEARTPVAGVSTNRGEEERENAQAAAQARARAETPPAPVPQIWTARLAQSAAGWDVIMEGPCPTGRCPLAPVPIGAGNAHAIGMIDLAGPPVELDSEQLSSELANAQLPAFVCAHSEGSGPGGAGYLIIVLARNGVARVVLSEETPNFVSSLNIRTERGANALDIVFVRTAMPSAGDREFRPGPPLTDRFSLTGETYTHVGR